MRIIITVSWAAITMHHPKTPGSTMGRKWKYALWGSEVPKGKKKKRKTIVDPKFGCGRPSCPSCIIWEMCMFYTLSDSSKMSKSFNMNVGNVLGVVFYSERKRCPWGSWNRTNQHKVCLCSYHLSKFQICVCVCMYTPIFWTF